jgi:hypothetical protein
MELVLKRIEECQLDNNYRLNRPHLFVANNLGNERQLSLLDSGNDWTNRLNGFVIEHFDQKKREILLAAIKQGAGKICLRLGIDVDGDGDKEDIVGFADDPIRIMNERFCFAMALMATDSDASIGEGDIEIGINPIRPLQTLAVPTPGLNQPLITIDDVFYVDLGAPLFRHKVIDTKMKTNKSLMYDTNDLAWLTGIPRYEGIEVRMFEKGFVFLSLAKPPSGENLTTIYLADIFGPGHEYGKIIVNTYHNIFNAPIKSQTVKKVYMDSGYSLMRFRGMLIIEFCGDLAWYKDQLFFDQHLDDVKQRAALIGGFITKFQQKRPDINPVKITMSLDIQ